MPTSCEKDEGNGKWRARHTWTDRTGRRHFRRVSARLKEDCERRLRDLIRESEQGPPPPKAQTLAAYAGEWLDHVARSQSPGTRRAHGQRIAHVLPLLGHRRLDTLTPADVRGVLAALERQGRLGESARGDVLVTLQTMLNAAVRDGVLARSPGAGIRRRRREPGSEGFTQDEVRRLADAAAEPDTRTAILLAAATGLRLGELLGLRWEDIDLDRGMVRVQRSRSHGEGGDRVGPPKTPASRRTVPIGPATVELLRQHRARTSGEGWVWPGRRGEVLARKTLQHRFMRLRVRAGVRPLPFHALRHSFATFMLEAGVHPRVVQDMLGHANIDVTMRTYSHLTDSVRWEAAIVSDRIVQG